MVLALRDVDGLPILAEFEVVGEEGPTTEYCVQPVTSEPLPGLTQTVVNPVDGREVYRIPLIGGLGEFQANAEDEEEDEPEVCDPLPAYAMYVAEAELERLNLARTTDDVIARKLADVTERLIVADELTLDGAGRLVIDGAVVDAGPEHAAMFQEIMETGALPTLDPAAIAPFGPWEMSAASIGAAASKFSPVSIDTVMYYNRITDAAPSDGWRADPLVLEPTGEEFVDYRGFTYDREAMFPGGVTWLDVPTLTWNTSRILDVVDFAPLPPNAVDGVLSNAAGYAQLVDDVRAAILYFHQYEALAGFFMDPVGVDTYDDQVAALTAPVVNVADIPAKVVQTEAFALTASVFHPWAGSTIADARQRVRVETEGGFTADDAARLSAVVEGSAEVITFELDGDALVGYWAPSTGFPVPPGYNVTSALEMRIGRDAPTGPYQLSVELLDGADVVASDAVSAEVLPAELTALWTSATRYVEQGSYARLDTRTVNPVGDGAATGAQLKLTLDPLATEGFVADGPRAALYSDAVSLPLTLNGEGELEGILDLPELADGASIDTTWWLVLTEGGPLGWFDLTVEVVGGAAAPDVTDIYVAEGPDRGGEPTDPAAAPTAPTAVTAVAGDASATVSWTPPVGGGPVSGYVVTSTPGDLTCVIWGATATSCTVTGLTNGTPYTFVVRAIGQGGLSVNSAPSSPVTPVAPPLTPTGSFVTASYTDFLDRAPTAGELGLWVAVLDAGKVDRSGFLGKLATSDEWLGAVVDGLYEDTLDRPADPSGKAYWVTQLRTGRYTVAQVTAMFYSSSEYFNGIGGGTNASWVTDLYAKLLNRAPDPSGLRYWVGVADRSGRYAVAYPMFQSPESARARVRALYDVLLDRAPDPAGLTYWAGQVVTRGDIVLAVQLAASSEYYRKAAVRFP